MAKLTQDKKQKILEVYDQVLEYKATAEKVGVFEATVKNVVEERRRRMSAGIGTTMTTSPSPEAISSGITMLSRGQTIKAAPGAVHGANNNNNTTTTTTNSRFLRREQQTMKVSMNATVQNDENSNGDIGDIQQYVESQIKRLVGIIFKELCAGKTPEYIAAHYRFDVDTVNYYYDLCQN